MDAKMRRDTIMRFLEHSQQPISATALAKECQVSRQLIVGDVALLRASGVQIVATPRGYLLEQESNELEKVIAVIHKKEHLQDELETIVGQGGSILDVIVEHPLYGELRGNLHIHSLYDVEQFIKRSEHSKAQPLSSLTEGIHLHTIRVHDEQCYQRILTKLKEKNYLYQKDDEISY